MVSSLKESPVNWERHIKKIKVIECSNLTDEIIIRYSGLGRHLTEAMAGVFTLFRKHGWE